MGYGDILICMGNALLQLNRADKSIFWLEKENDYMRGLGNFLWFVFGGLFSGLGWIISGFLWCITIIGIPYGLQCFKFAELSFFPFGKEIVYSSGAVDFLVNVIWLFLNGWWMALGNFLIGCLWCVTIIGIPFGKQFFKIAKLSLAPFGAKVVES